MGSNIAVRLLDKGSLEQQIDVYMRSFDVTRTVENVRSIWELEHYENPVHEAYIFGAFDDEKLVSINAYMPMRYRFNGTICNVIQSCVSGTLPEYRGKGIWSQVVKYAISYFLDEGMYDFLIGFPNFKTSYGGFIKMGWSHDSDALNYLMIINEKEFTKAATGRNLPLVGILGIQRLKLSLYSTSEYNIGDACLGAADSEKIGFSIAADNDFWLWKRRYKGLEAFSLYDKNDELIANCYYFCSTFHNAKIVKLCGVEVLNGSRDETHIYARCINEICQRHKDAAYIRALAMSGSVMNDVYRRLMFFKVGDSVHANPFITYCLKTDIVSAEMLHDKNNWVNATFLDLD